MANVRQNEVREHAVDTPNAHMHQYTYSLFHRCVKNIFAAQVIMRELVIC